MATKFLFLFLIFLSTLRAEEVCFFTPPKGWEIADPSKLSPRVHICFVSKQGKGLAPSVNLATEPVTISLDAYVEEVRKIHASDPNTRWRDLGNVKTQMGPGKLTELETQTELGKARLIQLIVLKSEVAYILTMGALKEEFSKYYKTFDQVIHSLQMSSDLVQSYPVGRRSMLEQIVKGVVSEENWGDFEKKIINDFTEMGPYWQILILNQVRSKLIPTESK